MTNQIINPNHTKKYDLAERTAKFGENIILFVRTIRINPITSPLVSQITRSATSIGANYMEADNASSKKDFVHKISICKKEASETMHWLRMMSIACSEKTDQCRLYWREAHELVLIFASIIKKR